MRASAAYQAQVKPESIVEYLGEVQWHNHTSKRILGKQHGIHLFGYLNPLRPICISVVSDLEMEWLYGQPESYLLTCPALQPQGVVIIVLSK